MRTKVCVIGSGAGAGPVIYELVKAGHEVVVLEKGPWIKTEQFTKDELVAVRRPVYIPDLRDERHAIVRPTKDGGWETTNTSRTGKDFWNGSLVGGSSNFMSGYFHRLKPNDFKLLSTYGNIPGANVVDWPISYGDMEPYYEKVERLIGVSGQVVDHPHQEPRSTPNFPYPALRENKVSSWLDDAAEKLGYPLTPIPRAILSQAKEERKPCYYSGHCGSFGCSSDAKGSSRASLINQVAEEDNCTIKPNSKVFYLETDGKHRLKKAWYYNQDGERESIEADYFVVACQAIETSRLLLASNNSEFPNGLANNHGQVGKNLLFSAGGSGSGQIMFDDLSESEIANIQIGGLFINRSIHEWYEINDDQFDGPVKGGIVDFLWEHRNPMTRAIKQKWDEDDQLVYGTALKSKIKNYFNNQRKLRFEVFNDWLPSDNCYVSLANKLKDKWGDKVGKVKLGYHEQDIKVGRFLASKAAELLKTSGAKNVRWGVNGNPPTNLQAGGCRFGNNPNNSVLDKNCRAHEVDNLYVTDGSFMPTGGSATYTWTIYANSFRVADHLKARLSNEL